MPVCHSVDSGSYPLLVTAVTFSQEQCPTTPYRSDRGRDAERGPGKSHSHQPVHIQQRGDGNSRHPLLAHDERGPAVVCLFCTQAEKRVIRVPFYTLQFGHVEKGIPFSTFFEKKLRGYS